jgi:hypothetical protein
MEDASHSRTARRAAPPPVSPVSPSRWRRDSLIESMSNVVRGNSILPPTRQRGNQSGHRGWPRAT